MELDHDAAGTPLLESMALPPVFPIDNERVLRPSLEKRALPLASPAPSLPTAQFTHALPVAHDGRRRRSGPTRSLPQCIAHRGYNARYPENTLAAFRGAVRAGAHAVETDVHLSRDGVVVLSHDATLARCYGEPGRLRDYDWEALRRFRTLREPREGLCRLRDLLEWLVADEEDEEGVEEGRRRNKDDVWVLLDIKTDNDPNEVMRCIADTLHQVSPSKTRPWEERIVLGIWATKYLPLCATHLPSFPVVHIGAFVLYAQCFLRVPNVAFNLLHYSLVGPFGAWFLRRARRLRRDVFAWTVNRDSMMRWCIQKQLDGVITDDPLRFLDVCRRWREDEGREEEATVRTGAVRVRLQVKDWVNVVRIQIFTLLIGFFLFWVSEIGRRMSG